MAATQDSGGLLAALSAELAGAVERAGAAIVTVHGRRFPATGIVWAENVVVTADHVLERDEDLRVTLPSGQDAPATVAGRDPGSDVAVLRVPGALPAPAELAPAGSVKVGHLVLALGRPGEAPMASFGVVSALGGRWRTARGGLVDDYLRADVVLYPGFSGGPLVDASGLVVGLNSSHLARGQELAIPAHTVSGIVQALLVQGRVRRAYLGVSSQPVQLPGGLRQKLGLQQETGLMVLWVEAHSPAEQGGLVMGDVLVALDGQTIGGVEDLQSVLASQAVGTSSSVTVVRGGERADLTVTLGERG